MADNKIKFLRGTADEYANATKDNDTIYFTTDDKRLHVGDNDVGTGQNTRGKVYLYDKINHQGSDTDEIYNDYKNNKAACGYSHAEGKETKAMGQASHAEGYLTIAEGQGSHSEGLSNRAYGSGSHAENFANNAMGCNSHVGGQNSIANGDCSFAHGNRVKALNEHEVAFGVANQSSIDTLFSIGNGTITNNQVVANSNAFEITKTTGKLFDKEIATKDDINAHAGNVDIHVTAAEKAGWNALSNPNLLINPDFKINQRGETEYTAAGYMVDKWQCIAANGKVAVGESGGITLTAADSGEVKLWNLFEENLDGEEITLSVCINNKIYNISGVASKNMTAWNKQLKIIFDEGYALFGSKTQAGDVFFVMLTAYAGKSFNCKWIKLERGSFATPFVPPDPTTELLKCQRYFHRLGGKNRYFRLYGIAYDSYDFKVLYQLPVEMRVTPSLTCSSGGWRFYVSKISSDNAGYWDNQCGAEFAINSTFSSPSNVEISVTLDSSKAVTISAGDNMMICTNYDSDSSGNQKYPGWLDFDAEII